MKLKTIIIEPDGEELRKLSSLMELDNNFDIIGTGVSAEDAIEMTKKNQEIHVAFVSGELPTSDGSFTSYCLKQSFGDIIIVMSSQIDSYAVTAFNMGLFDFLKKPLSLSRVEKCLEKVKQEAKQRFDAGSPAKNIMIKLKNGYKIIPINSVLYFELFDRKCYLIQEKNERLALNSYTIEMVEEEFGKFGFFRCYQSFVIQLAKIEEVASDAVNKIYYLTMSGSKVKIPISRTKYNELLNLLHENVAVTMKA